MTATPETILIEQRGEVEWVTLNRPDKLNAMSTQLVVELREYFERKCHDFDTRVIVLRGAGRAFCAGLDLAEATSSGRVTVEESFNGQTGIRDIYKAMRRCPQPIIALVNGAACGGGLSLALAADVRILSDTAKLNAAYLTIGLTGCDMGSSYFLPRLVGASLASELLLTGRFIHAEEALECRLASKVVPAGELEAAADALIEPMLATSKMGLRLTKDALNFSIDAPSMDAAMAMEDRQQVLMATSARDFAERAKGFK